MLHNLQLVNKLGDEDDVGVFGGGLLQRKVEDEQVGGDVPSADPDVGVHAEVRGHYRGAGMWRSLSEGIDAVRFSRNHSWGQ